MSSKPAIYYLCTLLCAGMLAGCSDPRSAGRGDVDPKWEIEIDHATGNVKATGRVFGTFGEIRLTEGDALRLSWAGTLWQLYRVRAPFVYTRVFAIPDNSNRFEARFDRSEPSLTPVVFNVMVPDMQTAMLVEESMTIPETGTLNLSWDYGSSPVSLTRQSVQTRILDCATAPNENDSRELTVDIGARSVSIDLQSLPTPAPASSRSCRYSIQLIADTFVDNPETVSVQTRSRLFGTSIEFTGSL